MTTGVHQQTRACLAVPACLRYRTPISVRSATSHKPRQGSVFDTRQSTRLQYRRRLREGQRTTDEIYTNELHEALLRKKAQPFFKCWQSKFESERKCIEVDGCVDVYVDVDVDV